MATWPADDLSTGDALSADTKSPLAARPSLYALFNKVKAMLAAIPAGQSPLLASDLLSSPVIDNATGIGQVQTFIAEADESNTTTTLGASTYLQTTLTANKWYRFKAFLVLNATTGYQIKVMAQNAAAAVDFVARAAGSPSIASFAALDGNTTILGAHADSNTEDIVTVEGTFQASASGGWIAVEYAVNAGGSGTTYLRRGSYLELTELT